MAYLETLTGQIVSALGDAGITAFTEFESEGAPLPRAEKFVTLAVSAMQTEPPLAYPSGTASPAELALRFRLHGMPRSSPDDLAILWEHYVLPVMLRGGYPITHAKLGETRYDKTLDRLVREGTVSLRALLLRISREEAVS